ncbi:hemagglutinin repeat-containing protein [Burkholderia multivorans]|uniref:hemagglutinin repeat-containing protein n=1 Tax=Burkholderia multivorans TaxID=87883 RepID=UPI00143E7C66|nr:hemagglutinin repeat-containing protein [Burkholderia multivorans]MBU9469086.1 hemagglutinin repeat-containing protein [Burkholderia multivorans]MCA8130133.1 hemagglutinin repeat-containing protein [Burkholderia multivorans]QIX17241.1 filamentous hemagglutinin N-terminal domain-containing protein [Burkholderia multivorans]
MNKKHYRLVFSRLHGMLVAVEETASAAGKASAGETQRAVDRSGMHGVAQFALRFAAFGALIAAGAMPMWVQAQIVGAGPNAPSVIQTPNGLPQVNINKPGGAGVSLNTYNQFDVQKNGAILNNSPTIVNTQQAGYINGNPNLSAGQAARIIVNQVSSTAASQIKGYVEVAGSRAEIVLANPAGIVVDGGGFINTSRAVLTTGVPQFGADGSLAGYNVSRGLITVQGAGLNASNVDQVDLIARAVQANAAIYAKNLNVIAGTNQVNHDTLAGTQIAGDGPAPAVAIDVAQLGGMYANRVFLVGNSAGVGVANAGTIAAQAGDLTLQSDGRLVLTGKSTASGNLALSAAGGIQNSGTTYAQQSLSASTSADLSNTGALAAQQNATVNAGSVNSTGTLGAGVNSDGTVAQSGDLNVTTTGQLSASGHTRAGGNATLQGAGLDLSSSTTSAGSALTLTTTQGDLNLAHASAIAGEALSATAAGALVNDGGNLSSGAAQAIHAGSVSNVGGQMVSGASLELDAAGAIDNRQGLMQAAGRATIIGASMNNSAGRATSLGTDGLSVHVNGALVNAAGTTAQGAAGGVIGSNGATDVSADTIANQGEFNSKTDLTVQSRTLDNHSGALLAGAKLDTIVVETLNNSQAKISGSTTHVSAASIQNDGGLIDGDELGVTTTGDLMNRGGVLRQYGQSDQRLSVGGTLDNGASGAIASNAHSLGISAHAIQNDTGSIQHAGTGTLDLNAGTISNSGQALTNGALRVTADTLSNQGKLGAKTDATIRAQTFDNHSGGVAAGAKLDTHVVGTLNNQQGLLSGSTNTISAASVDNGRGTIEGDALGVTTAGDLLNQNGSIQQYGKTDQTLSVGGALHNEQGTVTTNATNLTINAHSMSNDGGNVSHAGTGQLALTTTGAISNIGGQIVTNGDLVSRSSHLDNSSGVMSSQRVANILANTGIVNAGGKFYGKASLAASTQGDYVNSFGSTQSGGNLTVSTGGVLSNDQGIMSANGAHGTMDVSAASIVNRSGTLTNAGDGATTLSAVTIDNDGGTAGGNADLTVNAQRVTNTNNANLVAGKAGNFNIAQWLDNTRGTMYGGTLFSLNQAGASVLNDSGKIEGGQDVSVKVASLSNQAGAIRANRDVVVSGGVIGDGEMTAGRNLGLHVDGDYTNGAANRLRADGDMGVSATGTLTNAGTLAAVGAMHASGNNVVNQAGADINSAATTVTATDTLTNAGRIEGDSVTTNSTTLVNTGTVIGNDVLVNATDVRNTGAQAVIAGATKTRLYASNSITNSDGATIYSGGDLELAKDGTRDAAGLLAHQTNTITNDSANIEADGNLDVAAHTLINKRTSLLTEPGTPQSTSVSLDIYTAGIPIGKRTQWHYSKTFPQWTWGGEADPISGNMAGALRNPVTVTVPKSQVANLDANTQTFSLTQPIVETYNDLTKCEDVFCLRPVDQTRNIATNPTQTYNSIQDNGATYTITFWPDWDPKAQIRPDQVRVRTDLGPDSHDYVETQRTTTTTTTTDRLVAASDPAKMQAQGAIRINSDGGSITNESSIMAAGGDLVRRAAGGTVTDKGTVLQQSVSEQQTSTFYWHQKTGGDTDTQTVNYPVTPLPPTTIAALPAIATSNQTVQTDAQSINVTAVDRLGQTVTGSGVTGGNATGTQLGGLNGQIAGPNTPTGVTGQTSRPQTLGNASGGIPNLTLPTNGLYTYHPAPDQTFLIATDPRFTSYSKFISSDYMLGQLGVNPQTTIKRLGDGAYEERLVRDQVTQLTGRTFLAGYSDNLDEYTALMNNGVAYAKAFNLAVGVGLSDEQMRQLTTDMVWLVSQDVTLPDGSHQTVLVPKLYLAQANTVDLQHSGAIVAGSKVNLNGAGDVANSGHIVSDVATTVIGNTIVNRGVIGSGGTTAVAAVQDVRNVSGRIGGVDTVVRAGRDITNETETLGVSGAASTTGLVGQISAQGTRATGVISGTNDVQALAGRDVNVNGAAIQSGRNTSVGAGRDINVGTVSLKATQDVGTRDGLNGGHDDVTQHVGSAITAGGNVTTVSGRDTTLTNATVDGKNDVTMVAGGDLTATAAKDTQHHDERSLGGSLTQHTASSYDETVRGTDIHAGNSAVLGAGQNAVASTILAVGGVIAQADGSRIGNLTIAGSNVTTGQTAADGTISGGATKLVAKGDVNVGAVTETHDSQSWVHDERSGFLSKSETTDEKKSHQVQSIGSTVSGDTVSGSAGRDLTVAGSTVASTHDLSLEAGRNLTVNTTQDTSNSSSFHEEKKSGFGSAGSGISYGNRDQKDTTHDSSVTQNGSLVGSTDGSVSMKAGNDLHITGSDVIAAQDVSGIGKNVTIDSAINTTHHDETHEVKQSGFTLALKSPVIDAVQNVNQQARSAGQSQDGRAAALHGIAAAGGVADAFGAAKGLASSLGPGGKPEAKVELSFGSSQSKSTFSEDGTQNRGSNVKAGGTATFVATGDKSAGQGNVTIQGSDVNAKDVLLQATNQVNLLNSTDTDSTRSTNKSSSASVGVSFGTGGFGVSAAMSRAHGDANSDAAMQNNTHINASNTATIVSGGDTNVIGANVNANKVVADVGGNLNLASVQDTTHSAAHQSSTGGGFSISQGGGSASFSAQSGHASGNYAGVKEQAGIQAGSGGYDINVKGNTDLKGAYIASTATPDKNQLTTGTLSFSDIQNHSEYDASSVGVSAGGGIGDGGNSYATHGPTSTNGKNTGGALPLYVNESGSSSATTKSAISDGSITITDKGSQKQDLATLNRDTSNLNGKVDKTPDLQQVLSNQGDLMNAATAASEAIAKQIGNYADRKEKAARDAAAATDDPVLKAQYLQDAKNWAEGGDNRVALHIAGGALTGGLTAGGLGAVGGAAGAGVSAKLAPELTEIAQSIKDAGPTGNKNVDELLGNVASNLLAGGAGALVGGGTGALTGAAVDRFNRQLNQDEKKAIHDKANGNADEEKRLTQAACYRVQCWAEFSPNSPQWLANYVDPMDAKDLAPELQWIDSQKANKGLFDYTLIQQGKDLGLSQFDQFKRGVLGFGEEVKNLPRDVANSHVKLPTDVQQGDANPQIDPNGGGPKTPSGPAGATVTVGAVPCGPPGALCPTVNVAPVVTPGGPILSSGGKGDGQSNSTIGGKNISDLSDAAKVPDESDKSGQLSAAGRALQKHGGRTDSAFPTAKGNPAAINEQGQQIVDSILNDPGRTVTQRETGRFGNVIDITATDGRGIRYSVDGKFIGFLEPPK